MIHLLFALLAGPQPVIHPIVDPNVGCLLGAVRGAEWAEGKEAAGLRGGETYRIVTADGVAGRAIGSKPARTAELCPDTLMVSLSPEPANSDSTPYMAVAGDWNLQPRKAENILASKERYAKLFAPLLAKKKVRAKAEVQSLWRVDLDGDGKNEVVAVLGNFVYRAGDGEEPGPNAYSAVVVRNVSARGVEDHLVGFDQAQKDHEPTEFSVPLFLDLNGDGGLEMVVYGKASDGRHTGVYELRDIVTATSTKPGQALMSCYCGD